MLNRFTLTRKYARILIPLLTTVIMLIVFATPALAEYIRSIPIWNGITGSAETYGSRGVGCPSSGAAYSYTQSTDNIYYLEVYLKEISTYDYAHVINFKKGYNYYKNGAPTVAAPWPGCKYIYVVSRHIWRSSPNIGPTRYTSGDGAKSNQAFWNY